MWSIFDKPLDYPQGYIARKFEITKEGVKPTKDTIKDKSLEEIREGFIELCYFCIPREAADVPSLVESWME